MTTRNEASRVLQRDSYVYEAVQRTFRAWFVSHCRARLRQEYGDQALERLRRPFRTEMWAEIESASALSRSAGSVSSKVADEFDLLDVAHMANLVEAEFDVLFPGSPDEPARNRAGRRDAILRWIRTVKSVRDPISHPVEAEISLEDARATIDCARRVADAAGGSVVRRLSELYDSLEADPRDPLEASLPPSEMIGSSFVGRQAELSDLSDWLANRDARRWVLAGAGGRGKTAIAFEFARRVRDLAPRDLTFVLWLSAKRRRYVEGEIAEVPYADFSDVPSAIDRILLAFGWSTEASDDLVERTELAIKLLNQFPTLLVADDIDSLEGEDEGVNEFLTAVAFKTKTKVLLTSRRSLHGLGGSTTMVSGLSWGDFNTFVDERVARMGLDPAVFREERRKRIHDVTDGTPLFVEDLLRLAKVEPVDRAISLWRDKGGDNAREYALGRELEMLSRSATELLIAAAAPNSAVSKTELEFITRRSGAEVDAAIQELQQLFLLPRPRLIKDEERFQLDYNTRALVRRVASEHYADTLKRLRAAYQAVSGEAGGAALRRQRAGEYLRQAIFLAKSGDQDRAEETLQAGLNVMPEEGALLGQLGWLYKSWQPSARATDARAQFARAVELGAATVELYRHWVEMERMEEQWSRAIELGDIALQKYPDDQYLTYLTGYAHWRRGYELLQQVQPIGLADYRLAAQRLRRAILPGDRLDARDRITNSKAFSALCRCLADHVGALVATRDPENAAEIARVRAELRTELTRWKERHPSDPYATEAVGRLSDVAWLDAVPPLDKRTSEA